MKSSKLAIGAALLALPLLSACRDDRPGHHRPPHNRPGGHHGHDRPDGPGRPDRPRY